MICIDERGEKKKEKGYSFALCYLYITNRIEEHVTHFCGPHEMLLEKQGRHIIWFTILAQHTGIIRANVFGILSLFILQVTLS